MFRLADQTEIHKEKILEKSSDVKYAKCPGTVLIEPENGDLFAVLCSDSIRDRFQNSKYPTLGRKGSYGTQSHTKVHALPKSFREVSRKL